MVYIVLIIGLIFAYVNGMHDGGTIVATSVSSRLMTPRNAVTIAAISNFLGALVLGTAVAYTMSSTIVNGQLALDGGSSMTNSIMLATFAGSIIWNTLTFVIKMPSSASHSLIGSMVGAYMAAFGSVGVYWTNFMYKIVLAMVLSPLLGFVIAFILMKVQYNMLKYSSIKWEGRIRIVHRITTFLLAFAYGSNDSQKVMGLLALVIAAHDGTSLSFPFWLVCSVSFALALGTMTGGYNMIGTVGKDIAKINVDNSFISQLSTMGIVISSSMWGIPISTTQIITGSVLGVGAEERPRSVNWGIMYRIGMAWIFTLPASALCGYLLFLAIYRIMPYLEHAISIF